MAAAPAPNISSKVEPRIRWTSDTPTGSCGNTSKKLNTSAVVITPAHQQRERAAVVTQALPCQGGGQAEGRCGSDVTEGDFLGADDAGFDVHGRS